MLEHIQEKDKVLFSGYHGWTDWYLATNINNKGGLDEHLLSGLSTKGVPSGLKNTAIPFKYNDISDLQRVLDQHNDAGVICIEGARYDYATDEFLALITDVAKRRNLIIVSDEITSGWRVTDGGVYKLNNFQPDIVVYAKAMGGGYAISAVVGSADVMNSAQDTFMSSTMWTERVGFVAGLTTIDILVRNRVWEHLIKVGEHIGNGWLALASKYDLKINITEFKPLITMKFDYGTLNDALATLFIQEMLKRGYLAATSVYVSYAHTFGIVDAYLEAVDECFLILSDAINEGTVLKRLQTEVKSDSFNRLT